MLWFSLKQKRRENFHNNNFSRSGDREIFKRRRLRFAFHLNRASLLPFIIFLNILFPFLIILIVEGNTVKLLKLLNLKLLQLFNTPTLCPSIFRSTLNYHRRGRESKLWDNAWNVLPLSCSKEVLLFRKLSKPQFFGDEV